METSKKKKTNTQSRQSFWRQHYPLILSISTLLAIFLYIVLLENQKPVRDSIVIYPLLIWSGLIEVIFVYLIIPTIFIAILGMIIKRFQSRGLTFNTKWNDFVAFALILVFGMSLCMQLMVSMVHRDVYLHQDRLEIDNQLYMLTIFVEFIPNSSAIVYHCDATGIFCSKILETLFLDNTSSPAELAFNETTQELSIIINGEVVHTHQLEEQ